jgi:hypothetical protein
MDIIARENEIAREPHDDGDMAVLRDDELDAVTGAIESLGERKGWRATLGRATALLLVGAKAKIIDGRFSI